MTFILGKSSCYWLGRLALYSLSFFYNQMLFCILHSNKFDNTGFKFIKYFRLKLLKNTSKLLIKISMLINSYVFL